RKIRIPAVSRPSDLSVLPGWLGATQLGHYGDQAGISRLVSSIATLLSDPEFVRVSPPPQPIPALAVWLRQLDWNKHALEQFTISANREGLKLEILFDDTADEII